MIKSILVTLICPTDFYISTNCLQESQVQWKRSSRVSVCILEHMRLSLSLWSLALVEEKKLYVCWELTTYIEVWNQRWDERSDEVLVRACTGPSSGLKPGARCCVAILAVCCYFFFFFMLLLLRFCIDASSVGESWGVRSSAGCLGELNGAP